MLDDDNVLIVKEDGTVEEIIPASNAGDGVEELDGILCPGFINCHCHVELSHLKNAIPEQTGLVNFVQQVMGKRNALPEIKEAAMQNAETEMYNNGIVVVGDICNTADSVVLKKESKIHWHNFIEVSGFVDAVAEKRLAAAEEVMNQFPGSTLSPHSPYSVSKKLFKLLNEKTKNKIVTIHNQETAAENELYINKNGDFLELYKNLGIDISHFSATGKTSLQTWLPYFTNKQSIISVHNTFTSANDIGFAIKNSVSAIYYCLCINANLYIENKLPPITALIQNNCAIILGTDSYASNWQLNIMEEIKTIQQYFNEIPLATILQWATLNGAMALGIDNIFGSFKKNKKPGIILISKDVALSRRIL